MGKVIDNPILSDIKIYFAKSFFVSKRNKTDWSKLF